MLRWTLLLPVLCIAVTGGVERIRAQETPTGASAAPKLAEQSAAAQAAPANSTSPQAGASTACTLADGTPVVLRLTQTVSTALARANDPVRFEVAQEVKVGKVVVIPKGSQARGTVVIAKAKRSLGRSGQLAVRHNYVDVLATGQKAQLRGLQTRQGEGAKGGHGSLHNKCGCYERRDRCGSLWIDAQGARRHHCEGHDPDRVHRWQRGPRSREVPCNAGQQTWPAIDG